MGRIKRTAYHLYSSPPRTLIGVFVGASLAVAGALMQAMTRNPLASPQIFGVNAGASLFVVASLVILPASSYSSVVFAFAGAAAGGAIVYMIASSGGMTPVKLALSGMAVHLFLSSMTQAIIILNESGEDVLYWMTGAIDGSNWQDVMTIALFFCHRYRTCPCVFRSRFCSRTR